jgi:hypothetical protein
MFIRKITIFLFVLAASAAFMFVKPAEAIKLNIDPPRIEFSVKAGKTANGLVTLSNEEKDTALHIKVYLQDLIYLPDGTNDFMSPGSTPWSCAKWIKIRPVEFELLPGEKQNVRFNLFVPSDTKGGRYAIIFFEASPALVSGKRGASVDVNIRMGTIVLLTVQDTVTYKARLTNFEISDSDDKDFLNIVVSVYNDGNVLIRPIGKIKVEDENGKKIDEMDFNTKGGGVLPKTGREFIVKYKKPVSGGKYNGIITIDYGGEVLIGGQSKFTVSTGN